MWLGPLLGDFGCIECCSPIPEVPGREKLLGRGLWGFGPDPGHRSSNPCSHLSPFTCQGQESVLRRTPLMLGPKPFNPSKPLKALPGSFGSVEIHLLQRTPWTLKRSSASGCRRPRGDQATHAMCAHGSPARSVCAEIS